MRARLVGATLLAVVLVLLAAGLGRWQLEAWEQRRAAEARDLTQLEPVALLDVMGPDDPFPAKQVGRPVTIEGQWLTDGAFYVSNREQAGRDGFWAVVPLAVGDAGDPAIPVVIGWTDTVGSTTDATLPSGGGAVTGWLQPPESNSAVDEDPADDVVPQLRIADAIQRVDNDLYSAYAVGTQPSTGFAPASLDELPQVGRFTALRNLLYAFEWWFFGGFAAFVWWRWVQDLRSAEPVTDSPT